MQHKGSLNVVYGRKLMRPVQKVSVRGGSRRRLPPTHVSTLNSAPDRCYTCLTPRSRQIERFVQSATPWHMVTHNPRTLVGSAEMFMCSSVQRSTVVARRQMARRTSALGEDVEAMCDTVVSSIIMMMMVISWYDLVWKNDVPSIPWIVVV